MKLGEYKHYRIVIVGTGGTGSNLVSFVSHLIGNSKDLTEKTSILLIDHDTIEPKNLRNQKFLKDDIGKIKSEVLADRYGTVYDGLDISYVPELIKDKDRLDDLITADRNYYEKTENKQLNILISCVDNNKARRVFHELFVSEKGDVRDLLYIDTGNSVGDKLTGQTVVGYRKSKSKQIPHPRYGYNVLRFTNEANIILPDVTEYFPEILTDEDVEEEPTCGDINDLNVQNLGANITSAATTFNIVNNIICFKEIPGQFYMFDGRSIVVNKLR